ncbi:ATP-dependent helicase/nuclease subunit B [Pedobacter sp. CG_S7]|uniref:PD-(D/E)XK nuclease family protein n=1 Tax=Pedobacter sp. CG_S7 TaxID=3143930 RepID=UPI003391ACA6
MMKPFLKEVAEDLVAQLKDNLQHTAIIFNNKRPAAYLQNHLADIIKKPFWSPSFFTIQEFFALSTNLKIADSFTQFFTLYQQYNKLLKLSGSNVMELHQFYPIARIILSDFSQIDNDLVDADKLFKELEDIAEIDHQFDYLTAEQQQFLKDFWRSYSEGKQKRQQEQFIKMWRRMPDLYHAFHAALKEKGLITMGQVYRQLATGLATVPDFIQPFIDGKLVFVGFNALTQAEALVFKLWQNQGKALFYFDIDTYYIADKIQEAGLFLRKNLEKTGLHNALGESKTLIKATIKTIDVYQTQGQTAQAKILDQALQKDYPLIENNDGPGKVAIILADESLLLPVLQTIPTHFNLGLERHALNLNVTMGYPLVASSIFGLADLWLSVQTQMADDKLSVNFKEVEAFLSHPLTGISAHTRDKIQLKLIAEQLVEVPVLRLTGQKGLFELFFSKVSSAAAATLALQKVLKYVLEQQLENKILKQTETELFVAVIKELNRLHDALNTHLNAADHTNELPFVLSIIQRAVQSISVPLAGEPLQGIQVMGLLESRNLDFEQVYILGVNEGVLPQINISPSFIPDSIRRAHGLPVIENQDAISAYMFYRLLQRAEKISLVYNAQTDDNNTGEPSRFLRQLEYESGYQFNYLQHQQNISTESKIKVEIKKDPQVMGILNKYLTGEIRLSATALTTYINCPLQFFYKYVAKIEEPKEVAENVEANIIGLMLHWILETFYRELVLTHPEISKERIKQQRKNLPALAERAFAKIVFNNENHAVAHNGMQKVVLAIVEEYANIILDYDENHAPFQIISLEKKDQIAFKFEVNGAPKSITLFGIIDRIDQKNGVVRIVDYKTGNDDLKFSSIADVFDTNGNNQNKALLQTLFYTHVFEQANAKEWVEPNIYSVRKMRKEGSLFIDSSDKTQLNGERLQAIKGEFIEMLRLKLAELFDENIPFIPTTVETSFTYSPYVTLCGI